MADNTQLNVGAGGSVMRDKDRIGTRTPIVLLDLQDGAGNELIVNGNVPVTANAGINLNTSGLLKPADTLAGVTTVATLTNQAQMAGAAIAMNTGVRAAGVQRVTIATDDLVPVTIAAGVGTIAKAEDAPAANADTGDFVLGVRNDTPTSALTSANGDYSQISVDQAGVIWTRKRQLVTYDAIFRLVDATAGQLALTFTPAANVNQQLATIYHAATATKNVRICRIALIIAAGPSVAEVLDFEVRALSATTAPATGNPAITPRGHNGASAAAEATCLALPTTAGSLVGANTGTVGVPVEWNAAIATATANPSGLDGQEVVLYEFKDGFEEEPLVMRAGIAEGFAVNGRATGTAAIRFFIAVRFTEE